MGNTEKSMQEQSETNIKEIYFGHLLTTIIFIIYYSFDYGHHK